MSGQSPMFVQPFAAPYFAQAYRADALMDAPVRENIGGYDIVRQIAGPHAVVLVGRRSDGTLVVLKGFHPGASATPGWQAIRENEALRMIRFGFGGLLPIEESLSHPGGPITYLCMPYCQGGSLRDRLTAGDIGVAELAYHGLALACSTQRLHQHGVIHGDIKPDNVLFAHGDDGLGGRAVWRTWLSDLETLSEVGRATSWRMTPAYAAPEQINGAPAAPAMDVWAWGATVRYGLSFIGPLPTGWQWLSDLVEQTTSADPTERPTAAEIIDTYGRHVGFGDRKQPHLGAISGTAVAWYPIESMPPASYGSWAKRDRTFIAQMSVGWAGWLPEWQRLYELHTVPALLRIEELSTRVLGDPADPGSVWRAFRASPDVTALPVSTGAGVTMNVDSPADLPGWTVDLIPRRTALTFLNLLVMSLTELVEITGAQADIERLRAAAEAWESVGEFRDEGATALLAQAWLSLDEPERALPYVRRSYAADNSDPSALVAMRVYYIVTGDHKMAATVAMQGFEKDSKRQLRWLVLAVGDLLEAGDYDQVDMILHECSSFKIDSFFLVKCVLAGRRGPVQPDPEWLWLREHFTTLSSKTSIQKLRLLVEAALQRGDVDYAKRRANVVRERPVIRMPINHHTRAAIEAVALGRDPVDRSLTARLNNRAELWASDDRPDDPLVGLGLVAAQRWVSGTGRADVIADAQELVEHSQLLAGERAELLLRSTRHCIKCSASNQVAHLSVCGSCHRLLCAECTDLTALDRPCICGGDLAHPLATHNR